MRHPHAGPGAGVDGRRRRAPVARATASEGPRRRPWLLGLVCLLLMSPAAPAVAHDTLIGTDPADGQSLEEAPDHLTLTFSAEQLEVGTAVQVLGPDGLDHAEGRPTVSGAEVSQALGGLAAGTYEVQWRSVSGDGHALDGTFDFTVLAGPEPAPTPVPAAAESGPAAAGGTTASDATADATPAAEDTTAEADGPASDGGLPVGLVVAGSVLALVALVVTVTLLRRRRA